MIAVNAIMDKNATCRNNTIDSNGMAHSETNGQFTGDGLHKEENPEFKNKIQNFIDKATSDKQSNEELEIGQVSKKLVELAKKHGANIEGYKHTIDSKAIRHRNNGHLNGSAEDVSDDDLKHIPDVLYSPDTTDYFVRKKEDRINYSKKIGNDTYLYIEEVRNGNKTLTTKTIYKKVGAPNAEKSAKEVTSETPTNNNIITDVKNDFNPTAKNQIQQNAASDDVNLSEFIEILKAINDGTGKWITVHPNGKENKGRHLLFKDGENLEQAMHRQGWYSKRQAREDKNKNKETYIQITKDDFNKKYPQLVRQAKKHTDIKFLHTGQEKVLNPYYTDTIAKINMQKVQEKNKLYDEIEKSYSPNAPYQNPMDDFIQRQKSYKPWKYGKNGFQEDEHPRDEKGQFTESDSSNKVNISEEEYSNPQKDFNLPELPAKVLEKLGKKQKPIVLKKNIIEKNKNNHKELNIAEYNDVLNKGLYQADIAFKNKPNDEYFNFVHYGEKENPQVLIELSETKDNYEIVNFYKMRDKSLNEKLKKAVDFVYNAPPVAKLTGDEFQKDEISIIDKVENYYKENYPKGVNNPILGNVELLRRGVKDSWAHSAHSKKAAAYAAVPNIIEKGYVFNQEKNWKNRGYDTAVIIAPFQIGDEPYIGEVVIKQFANRQGFYVHEV